MGLYQKLMALSESPKGLLNKAQAVHVSFFEQFCRDYGYSHVCLLVREGSLYKAAYLHGMKQESIVHSCSTSDFWDGTLFSDNTEWLTISGDKLVTFLQLFCEEDRDTIKQLLIRRVFNQKYHLDYIILIPQEAEYSFYTVEELNVSLVRLNEFLMS